MSSQSPSQTSPAGKSTGGSAPDTKQHSAPSNQEANDTTKYQAPYYRSGPKPTVSFMVAFQNDHTMEMHLAFLGRTFEHRVFLRGDAYAADMDEELFEAVRCDPGVKFIEDDPDVEWEESD